MALVQTNFTQTQLETLEKDHLVGHLSVVPPSPFDLYPLELVDLAIRNLQDEGLHPVEWRSLLYTRMDVPLFSKDFSWILPDNELSKATRILTHLGLSSSGHTILKAKTEGDYHTKGFYHRITKATSPALVQHIVLYPASFITLDMASCNFSDSMLYPDHGKPLSCPQYLVPPPQIVFACIMRMMSHYTRYDATRICLAAELQELLDYHLLQLDMGYVSWDDEEQVEELDVSGRTSKAITQVRTWEWPVNEEWMVDALVAVLLGEGRIDFLPWKTREDS